MRFVVLLTTERQVPVVESALGRPKMRLPAARKELELNHALNVMGVEVLGKRVVPATRLM